MLLRSSLIWPPRGIPVRTTYRVLGFSTQASYKRLARPSSDRDWADAHTTNTIIDLHADDPDFGDRFIADELGAVGQGPERGG